MAWLRNPLPLNPGCRVLVRLRNPKILNPGCRVLVRLRNPLPINPGCRVLVRLRNPKPWVPCFGAAPEPAAPKPWVPCFGAAPEPPAPVVTPIPSTPPPLNPDPRPCCHPHTLLPVPSDPPPLTPPLLPYLPPCRGLARPWNQWLQLLHDCQDKAVAAADMAVHQLSRYRLRTHARGRPVALTLAWPDLTCIPAHIQMPCPPHHKGIVSCIPATQYPCPPHTCAGVPPLPSTS